MNELDVWDRSKASERSHIREISVYSKRVSACPCNRVCTEVKCSEVQNVWLYALPSRHSSSSYDWGGSNLITTRKENETHK